MTTIILEEKNDLLLKDCFDKIKTVYINWLNELKEARKSKNDTIIFSLKSTFSQENLIRDYIFKKLIKFWYKNFEKEVWKWKWRKDIIYTISNVWFQFVIEAKRLDWENNLNTEYIKNWVNRFKNKNGATDYSQDIKKNENIAWMLWFIIKDWKIDLIITDIKGKILKNDKKDEILENQYIIKKEDSFISKNWYFENDNRTSNSFTLYHYFLDFSEK